MHLGFNIDLVPASKEIMPNMRRTKKLQRKGEKCEDPRRKQAKDMCSVFYQIGCNGDAGDH